jgi:conjugal transfer pilus assembly protein TraB
LNSRVGNRAKEESTKEQHFNRAIELAERALIIDSTDGNQVFQSASAGDVGAVAGYNGLATAAEKVSDYYLKIAEDLYPVVELNAGRKIDLILLQGMALDVRG